MTRTALAIIAAGAALAGAPATSLGAGLTAVKTRVSETPTSVRVIVDFAGGAPVRALEGQVESPDPSPANGTSSVVVTQPGTRSTARQVQTLGVRVTVTAGGGRITVKMLSPVRRFLFLDYHTSGDGRHLVIDLIKSTTRASARILNDGCLKLTSWAGGHGRATAKGLELRPLFEHGLALTLRDGAGRLLGLQPVTAQEGVFLPDFSGYASPGHWSGGVAYTIPQPRRAMLQAWSASARDGSLDCLVQTPVNLRPR
jgi:hypothetical protein